MSSDLIWLLTRNNSSFLVKRSGVQFSREAGNLTNLNSFKYSGIANPKTVDVSAAAKGVTVSLKKKTVVATKPGRSIQKATIAKPGARTVVKSVRNLVKSYRPDLQKAAIARAVRILDTQKPVTPQG
ncbi:ribosomal L28e/Mak16 [Chytridium lagenaria]|nr:ribosomal L28e/Mak16 [Chytridium lagenaria]